MAARNSLNSSTPSLLPELDMQMLCDAQACLRCLHAHETPSAVQSQAFHSLHAMYNPVIRGFVLGYRVPANDADDVCQEVWKDLYIKLVSFVSDGRKSRFCSWLKRIARSKATNFLRSRLRHPTKELDAFQEAALQSHPSVFTQDDEHQRLQKAVQHVLDLLRNHVSETSFRVLWLRSMEERCVSDVAAELRLKPSQVCLLFCRARKRFRCLWMQASRDLHLTLL